MTPVEFPGFGNPTVLLQVVHVRGIWLSSTQIDTLCIVSAIFCKFKISSK